MRPGRPPRCSTHARVALLGAGGVGVCAALELADRGLRVDLYDENPEPIRRASLNNEGKIHLGLVYARDRSLRTARTMIRGAIHFSSCLNRWIDFDPTDGIESTPYYYAVHKGTMTGAEDLKRHYDECRRLLEDACASTGLAYLGRDKTLIAEEIPREAMAKIVDPDSFTSVFRTSERAVDPRIIGARLRSAVRANPRIRLIANARVSGVASSDGGRLRVSFLLDGDEYTERYDQVANTLWHGRLGADAAFGLAPEREWIHRYKVGGRIGIPLEPQDVPSLTCVLGPYGDLVNFGSQGLYFSWYPAGMLGTSTELTPPDWDRSLPSAALQDALRRSFEALRARCPGLRSIELSAHEVEPVGGVIFGWGATDIDHQDSRLHTRYEVGVRTLGSYHSVNTGKYTMIPYLACQLADRIEGIS